jgi:hypothetical protein
MKDYLHNDIPSGIKVVKAMYIIVLLVAQLTDSLAKVKAKLPTTRLTLTPALSIK